MGHPIRRRPDRVCKRQTRCTDCQQWSRCRQITGVARCIHDLPERSLGQRLLRQRPEVRPKDQPIPTQPSISCEGGRGIRSVRRAQPTQKGRETSRRWRQCRGRGEERRRAEGGRLKSEPSRNEPILTMLQETENVSTDEI